MHAYHLFDNRDAITGGKWYIHYHASSSGLFDVKPPVIMKNRWMTYLLMIAVAIVGLQCTRDDESGEGEPNPTGNSSEKSITSFAFDGVTGVTTAIDQAAKTVTLIVPFGTDRQTLVPVIGISQYATISPASNVMQDFTNPVVYTVTAQNAGQQAYTVTVVMAGPTVSCLPSNIPLRDEQLEVVYDEDGRVYRVDYNANGEQFPGDRYIDFAIYHYTGGLVSRIDYDLAWVDEPDPDVDAYEIFDHSTPGKIVITLHDKDLDENWNIMQITHYYLTGDKVTSFATYVDDGPRIDSSVYTYNLAGNVERADKYDGTNTTSNGYQLFEYDNKINVFALTGISGHEMLFFFNEYNLSINNVTKSTLHYGSQVYETDYAYTYDSVDKPLTLSWSYDGTTSPAYPYVYPCE
jgi:hypothetical protein